MLAPHLRALCLTSALIFSVGAGHASAQDADVSPTALFVELNTLTAIDGSCRLTFMATNAMGSDIDQLVLETVILTSEGVVDRLSLFNFRDLPSARPRVRQFDVPGLTCNSVGRVLVNGIETCTGNDLTKATCSDNLDLSSRTGVEVIG